MEWLKLGQFTQGDLVFLVWLFGFVGGYCFGRAHAAWITLRNFVKAHNVK